MVGAVAVVVVLWVGAVPAAGVVVAVVGAAGAVVAGAAAWGAAAGDGGSGVAAGFDGDVPAGRGACATVSTSTYTALTVLQSGADMTACKSASSLP